MTLEYMVNIICTGLLEQCTGTGGAITPLPDFDCSVNPSSTRRGTDYAHLITTGTPGFSDFPKALELKKIIEHSSALEDLTLDKEEMVFCYQNCEKKLF